MSGSSKKNSSIQAIWESTCKSVISALEICGTSCAASSGRDLNRSTVRDTAGSGQSSCPHLPGTDIEWQTASQRNPTRMPDEMQSQETGRVPHLRHNPEAGPPEKAPG